MKIYTFIAFVVFLNILPLADISNTIEELGWSPQFDLEKMINTY